MFLFQNILDELENTKFWWLAPTLDLRTKLFEVWFPKGLFTLWRLLCICELRTVAFHAQLFSQQKFRKRNECFSSCPCKCSICKNGLSTLTLWIFEDNLPLQKFRSFSDAQMHVLLPLTLGVCRPVRGGTKYGKYCDGICHCPAVKFQNRKLMLKKTVISVSSEYMTINLYRRCQCRMWIGKSPGASRSLRGTPK